VERITSVLGATEVATEKKRRHVFRKGKNPPSLPGVRLQKLTEEAGSNVGGSTSVPTTTQNHKGK